MPISWNCVCGKSRKVPDEKTGQSVRCPVSGEVQQLPPGTWSRGPLLLVLAASLILGVLSVAPFWFGPALFSHEPVQKKGPEVPSDIAALARQAQEVLATHCYRCHGENGTVEGGFNHIMDRDRLVARKKILPGKPGQSLLLQRIIEGEMPPAGEKPRPGKKEIAILERWIASEAPAFGPASDGQRFISSTQVLQSIREDLEKRGERDRRFTRYFTLTHLLNAGFSEDEVKTYRNGLSKMVNSLSWKKAIAVPAGIDVARTVLRIDLRDYGWTEKEWEVLLAAYPYGIDDDSPAVKYTRNVTDTSLPYLRGDWLVANASRPPLYPRLLKLPGTEGELEKLLHVDTQANLRSERVVRAGFNGSGVSRNNRLIERHETAYGAYWKSYDFAENTGSQNLFERPLGPGMDDRLFQHVGGEIIFNLPNGLQGYLLVNGKGESIDKAPTAIVSDPKRPDRAVENGLSCMACHSRGVNPKKDQIRGHVQANPKGFPNKEEVDTILALYPRAEVLDALLRQDAERFGKAAAAAGARVGTTEPILALATQFEAPLDLRRAAAEVWLRPEVFLAHMEKSPEIGRALGALKLADGTVSREAFARSFPEMIHAWKIGTMVQGNRQEGVPAIPAPKLTGKIEIKLPEPFEQVRTGGAGRYLIFHCKKAGKLLVFDVSQAKLTHKLDVPDDVKYAAGLDKLMVAVPGQRLLQRWDLASGQREKTVPIPESGPVLAALMGCNGRGPFLLFIGTQFVAWDLEQMKPIGGDNTGLGGEPKWDFQARISADGQTLLVWPGGIYPSQYGLVRLRRPKNSVAKSPDGHSHNGHWAMPNADASLVFRSGPGIYDGDMRIISAEVFKNRVLLPTEDPRFFLSFQEESRETNAVSLCTSVDHQIILKVGGLEKMEGSSDPVGWGHIRGEMRVHYLPSANVLVTLPQTNDRVVLRPLNLIETLNRSGQDYLFVLSRPTPRIAPGATFTYRIDAQSKSVGIHYKLETGPEGMTVSGSGVVQWIVPASPEAKPVRVIITLRSTSGKEMQHAFELTVVKP